MNFGVSIRGLIHLLEVVGDTGWLRELRGHLQHWEATGDASPHRSIYGGMGSFNDIVICRINHHKVTDEQEPWANALLMDLQSVCHAFSAGENFKANAWNGESRKVLQGWACRDCAYCEITHRDTDSFLAPRLVDPMVRDGMLNSDVVSVVDRVLALNIPCLTERRSQVLEQAESSGIHVSKRTGWMRPCPHCGENNTCVYRWVHLERGFVPSSDNLKLKKKK